MLATHPLLRASGEQLSLNLIEPPALGIGYWETNLKTGSQTRLSIEAFTPTLRQYETPYHNFETTLFTLHETPTTPAFFKDFLDRMLDGTTLIKRWEFPFSLAKELMGAPDVPSARDCLLFLKVQDKQAHYHFTVCQRLDHFECFTIKSGSFAELFPFEVFRSIYEALRVENPWLHAGESMRLADEDLRPFYVIDIQYLFRAYFLPHDNLKTNETLSHDLTFMPETVRPRLYDLIPLNSQGAAWLTTLLTGKPVGFFLPKAPFLFE